MSFVLFLRCWVGVALPSPYGVVTFVIYSPALPNQFLDWDDSANFLNNPHFRGLGWEQLRWMFTTFLMGHWIPLTWITFGLDYLVWGMNPIGYHLTNILLHAANAAAFYFVAYRLLAKAMTGFGEIGLRLGAATAALSFALHPLRAESVAWVTERRDVLSGLFFLLTILTYLNACDAQGATRRRWLGSSVGCYILALASKSIVMTLPFVRCPERAVASRPHLLVAHHNLGFVLLRVGDPARASEHFQRVLSEDSGNVDARTYLGEALVQQRKPGEAVPHLELAIRQNPTHMGALTHLGIALVELGRPMEAIPYFQRAIALYQNAPLPRLGLARAYLALGNTAAAKEQSEILRRLNPRLARQLSPPTSAGSPAERR